MDKRFASLRVIAVALKVLAVAVAAVVGMVSLALIIDVMNYIDPYYGDISYWLGDLVAPFLVGIGGLIAAAFIWALADALRLLLAVEENTRAAAIALGAQLDEPAAPGSPPTTPPGASGSPGSAASGSPASPAYKAPSADSEPPSTEA